MSFFYNEPSEIASLLDVVARGCEKYMRVGGGGLSGESPQNRGVEAKRMTPEQREQARRLIVSGHYTGTEIARMIGSNQTTICNLAGRLGVRLRDGRIIENRREKA